MLTALQERFARAYVGQADGNAAEAVRIAGSSASTPDSRSSLGRKWLALPEVKERIQALRDSAAQTQLMDRNGRIRELEAIATDPNINVSHRLRALDMLNRMHGDYDAIRAVVQPEQPKERELTMAELHYFLLTSRRPRKGMSEREIYAELIHGGYDRPELIDLYEKSAG